MRIFLSISLCAIYPIHSIKLEKKQKTMHNILDENNKKSIFYKSMEIRSEFVTMMNFEMF